MKKFLLIIFCTIIFPLSAFSATLKEALKQTFDNNLELQAEDGIRDRSPSRGLGDVYKRQS